MKIKCISNKGNSLNKCNIVPKENLTEKTIFDITPEQEYVVYGIVIRNNSVWYYIADDNFFGSEFPVWYPAELFKIVDNKISTTWILGLRENDSDKKELKLFLSFPNWVNDKYFYDSLVNKEKEAVELFMRYKKIMDEEYDKYIMWESPKIKSNLYTGDKIINALEEYLNENGKYPVQLTNLIPDYTNEINLPVTEKKQWIYTRKSENEYFFGFEVEEEGKNYIYYRINREPNWEKIKA